MGGSRSGKPREEPKPETMERCWLLTGSLALSLARTQLTFLYSPGPPAGVGTNHSGMDHSVSSSNQRNVPQKCPQINLEEALAKLGFFFPGDTRLVRWTIKSTNTDIFRGDSELRT